MGLFDYLYCEAPLPEVSGVPTPPPGTEFQTKDTPDQYMTRYWITADGKLMWRPYEMVTVPPEERPYPNGKGWRGAAGMLRRVEREPEAVDFHGDIWFGLFDQQTKEDWDYRARFCEGRLMKIELMSYEIHCNG